MKKLLAMTLVCITIISSTAFAEKSAAFPITEVKPPSGVIPVPVQPIDYRSYTGFKIINNKESKEGKVTMQVYHMKMNNKDMLWYFVQYCTYGKTVSTCSYFSPNGWVEGKVAGNNWIIRNGNFDAVLGKNNGVIKSDSIHTILKIE